MPPWRSLIALALIVAFTGCSPSDDADDAGAAAAPEASIGETDADTSTDAASDTRSGVGQPADRLVLVRNLVTEAEADDAIALLADQGFDGFVKQPSGVLLPTATEGWDVVRPGLAERDASQLAAAIATDPEVPYVGTIFVVVDDDADGATDGDADGDGGESGAPNLPSGTATVTVGAQTWTFDLTGGEGMCSTSSSNGVVGTGRAFDASGATDPSGAVLSMNIYPEDWEAKGTQANSIRVDTPGEDADWRTAAPGTADEAGIPELADAVVNTWTYDDGWAAGTATFYLESSFDDAELDLGDLLTETGSFEINCR